MLRKALKLMRCSDIRQSIDTHASVKKMLRKFRVFCQNLDMSLTKIVCIFKLTQDKILFQNNSKIRIAKLGIHPP